MTSDTLKSSETMNIHTDGASRNNPGRASCAYVFSTEEGEVIEKGGTFLGESTNNEAEYQAVILALENADNYHDGPITIFSDSQLV